MRYIVERIDEDIDFGCEERVEESPRMALVTLIDSEGNRFTIRHEDQLLYDHKVDEGDEVSFDNEKHLHSVRQPLSKKN